MPGSRLPAVSATSQSGKDLTLSILNWWAGRIHKGPASDTRPVIQNVSVALSSFQERSDVRCGTYAYLIVTDGHRGMQKVPDLSEVLKPLFLQLYPLGVTLEDGFVDEESEFFDL